MAAFCAIPSGLAFFIVATATKIWRMTSRESCLTKANVQQAGDASGE
jgi:hypothetical protein